MQERDDPEIIGRRVQQLRADRGLTQRQLAEPAYTPAYISTLEAGRVRPSDDALRHLAERLGVAYEEFGTGRPAHLAPPPRHRAPPAPHRGPTHPGHRGVGGGGRAVRRPPGGGGVARPRG